MGDPLKEKREVFRRWTLLRSVGEASRRTAEAAGAYPQVAAQLRELAERMAALWQRLERAEVCVTVVVSPVDQWISILLMVLYSPRPKWAMGASKEWNPPLALISRN